MSTTRPPAASSTTASSAAPPQPLFEQQREILLKEIAVSFEHVLANMNKLNRSLEGVIAVGNEFSSVEALWSQFENVMAKNPDAEGVAETGHGEEWEGEGEEGDETEVGERKTSRKR